MNIFTKTILALIITATLGSCASTYIRSGKEAHDDLMYQEAIKNLNKGLAKKDDIEGLKLLAQSYMKVNNFDQAKATYERLSKLSGVSDINRLDFAMALMSMKDYDAARTELLKLNNSPMATRLLSSLDKHRDLMKDSSLFEVKMIDISGISTAFSPVITKDGIIVSGERSIGEKDPYTNLSYTDLFEVKKEGDTWSKAKRMSTKLNQKYHDGIATLSADGKTMIFSRSFYVAKNKLGKDLVNVNNIQLYESHIENDTVWSEPEKLRLSDDQFMFAHPALSPDGNTLYFSSDIPEGFGGMDLYKSVKKENGKWDKPVNLGASINTPGQEVFPTLRGNDTLYYSSDSQLTIGGLDILYSVHKDAAWSAPVHLSYPLNSSSDDFGMVFNDRNKGYFSSDRTNTDNIYSFEMFDPEINILAKILDEETNLPIANTKIIIRNLTDGTEEVIYTDKDGAFNYELIPGKKYEIATENENYFARTIDISTEGITEDTTFTESYNLKRLIVESVDGTDSTKPGEDGVYPINNIYWDYNKWDVRPDAEPYLMDLVKLFNDNQNLDIEIQSHCDCRGGAYYNKRLSKKRAAAVVDYLVLKGIPRKMLVSKGYGKGKLKVKCDTCDSCSDEQHQENRRTEFVVKDKN